MKKEYLLRKFGSLPTISRRKEIEQDQSTQQRAGPGFSGQVVTVVPESAIQLHSQVVRRLLNEPMRWTLQGTSGNTYNRMEMFMPSSQLA